MDREVISAGEAVNVANLLTGHDVLIQLPSAELCLCTQCSAAGMRASIRSRDETYWFESFLRAEITDE